MLFAVCYLLVFVKVVSLLVLNKLRDQGKINTVVQDQVNVEA